LKSYCELLEPSATVSSSSSSHDMTSVVQAHSASGTRYKVCATCDIKQYLQYERVQ